MELSCGPPDSGGPPGPRRSKSTREPHGVQILASRRQVERTTRRTVNWSGWLGRAPEVPRRRRTRCSARTYLPDTRNNDSARDAIELPRVRDSEQQ